MSRGVILAALGMAGIGLGTSAVANTGSFDWTSAENSVRADSFDWTMISPFDPDRRIDLGDGTDGDTDGLDGGREELSFDWT